MHNKLATLCKSSREATVPKCNLSCKLKVQADRQSWLATPAKLELAYEA